MLGDPPPIPFDPGLLRRSTDLRLLGIDPGRSGWHHVRHGWWVDQTVWAGCTPEQRHAAVVHATDLSCREPGRHVYVLESAAAVWGLPRVEDWPQHVTMLVRGPRTRGSRMLRPHVGAPAEPVRRGGLLLTDVARTVIDLARTGSLATAFCAADHALRHRLCTASALREAADAVPARVRGRPTASLVAELADGRSMSAGESLSRARMLELGVPRPQLQVPVEDADGPIGLVDFGWPGVAGEFDGRRKYAVPAGATPREAEQVLWAEKLREDRIRRQLRLARWTWRDAMAPARLGPILAEQGVRPVPRPGWVDLAPRRVS